MPAGQEFERLELALHADNAVEVGIEDEQAALGDVLVEMDRERAIITLAEVGGLSVKAFEELLHLPGLLGGGQEGLEMVGKGGKADLILAAKGHVGEDEAGVDGVIEKRHAAEGRLHDATLVNDAVNLLGALVLVGVDHDLVAAGAGFPIDGAIVVAADVLFDVLELGVVPQATDTLNPELGEVMVGGEQLVLVKHEVGRVDLYLLRLAIGDASCHEAKRRGDKESDAAEIVDASADGA